MKAMSELLLQAFSHASSLDPEDQETLALSILRDLELPVIEASAVRHFQLMTHATIELYEALVAAGVDETRARAAASSVLSAE